MSSSCEALAAKRWWASKDRSRRARVWSKVSASCLSSSAGPWALIRYDSSPSPARAAASLMVCRGARRRRESSHPAARPKAATSVAPSTDTVSTVAQTSSFERTVLVSAYESGDGSTSGELGRSQARRAARTPGAARS
ncbi:hypothetical protein NKH77_31905 [Streptomyces sp. M19]